jgi:hypothetical protein
MKTNQEIALAILAAFLIVGILTLIGAYLIIGMGWQEFDAVDEGRNRWIGERPSGWALIGRALRLKCPAAAGSPAHILR